MKIDIIVVHIALVAAVVVPYILFIIIAAKQRKELRKLFNEEAKRNGLKIDLVEKWNQNVIGIDQNQQKILLFQKRRESIYIQIVDLKSVRSCSLQHQDRLVKINKKNANILQRIDLELTHYSGDVQLVNLYDSDETYFEEYERKHAENWNRIINESLHFHPTHTVAA